MSHTDGDVESEQTPKKPASLAKTLLMLVVGMSAYVYLRLSSSRLVFPGVLVALSILEVVRLIKGFRGGNGVRESGEAISAVCRETKGGKRYLTPFPPWGEILFGAFGIGVALTPFGPLEVPVLAVEDWVHANQVAAELSGSH
ncbi:MAG: hypothetical protein ABSF45_15575 [Terriglobia bacterium]|jgi:hypothetical protein